MLDTLSSVTTPELIEVELHPAGLLPRALAWLIDTSIRFAVLLLLAHYLDLYWNVMPNLDHHGAHVSWIDFATFLGPVGVLCWWLARAASTSNLFPLKDPRLAEARKLVNL